MTAPLPPGDQPLSRRATKRLIAGAIVLVVGGAVLAALYFASTQRETPADPATAEPMLMPFRITPQRPIAELRREALAATPPEEAGPFAEPDLVELVRLDSTIQLDIRYATDDNFLGVPVYEQARAFLQRPAAEALVAAHRDLRREGFGLVVYDGYRPWYVTNIFWEAVPDSLHHFVADPAAGSRHNRGAAVDVGLYDRKTGEPVEMPSDYDEFTERAAADFAGAPRTARRHRDLLRAAMEAQGFAVYPAEWWHFDFEGWQEYPILNIPFAEIERAEP